MADITVYWGPTDGDTNATDWAHTNVLGELGEGAFATETTKDVLYGLTYYCRCYASNAVDDAWAPSTTNFLTVSQGTGITIPTNPTTPCRSWPIRLPGRSSRPSTSC